MTTSRTYEDTSRNVTADAGYTRALVRSGTGMLTFTGILSIIAGTLFLTIRWSVFGLAIVTGIFLIARGSGAIGMARNEKGSGWTVFAGFVGIVAGLVALGWPGRTLFVLAVVVGVWLVVNGVVDIVAALSDTSQPYWWLTLLAGLISLPLGMWSLGHPQITLAAMTIITGVWAITTGVTQIALASQLRREAG